MLVFCLVFFFFEFFVFLVFCVFGILFFVFFGSPLRGNDYAFLSVLMQIVLFRSSIQVFFLSASELIVSLLCK